MPLSPEDIRKLHAFSRWANAKMLESVSPLTPEEYARPIGGSFGSVQGTLAHLYGADWAWLERCNGRSPRGLPDSQQVSTLAELREKWGRVEEAQREFLAGLTPERISQTLTYVNFAGQTCSYGLWEALLHLVNHSTYHRGQVATLLRQLGKPAVATDYLRYLDAGSPG
jgi:uncharacterized damage-inducible protein DinB